MLEIDSATGRGQISQGFNSRPNTWHFLLRDEAWKGLELLERSRDINQQEFV